MAPTAPARVGLLIGSALLVGPLQRPIGPGILPAQRHSKLLANQIAPAHTIFA